MAHNIVYIHSHDSGRVIQPYGAAVSSPSLQAFAEDSVIFRNAFSSSPGCSPSRASLLTGQWAHSTGMLGLAHRGFSLENLDNHLVNVLRGAGYETVLAGLQHVHLDSTAIGYDVTMDHLGTHSSSDIADRAVSYLQEERERPFFLDVGFFDTHRAYPEPGPEDDARWIAPPAGIPDLPETRQDMAGYQASLRRFDAAVGRILEAIRERSLEDSTIVIITTDHGLPWPGMKVNLTDAGLGVMLMVRGPGDWSGGRIVDAIVSQVDVVPTLCDLVGIPVPPHVHGVSLVPLVEQEAAQVRSEIFGEVNYHVGYEPQRCVRTTRWKYIRRYADRSGQPLAHTDASITRDLAEAAGWYAQPYTQEMLFDTELDPLERVNRVEDPDLSTILEELRETLDTWQRETSDPLLDGDVPLPPGGVAGDLDS